MDTIYVSHGRYVSNEDVKENFEKLEIWGSEWVFTKVILSGFTFGYDKKEEAVKCLVGLDMEIEFVERLVMIVYEQYIKDEDIAELVKGTHPEQLELAAAQLMERVFNKDLNKEIADEIDVQREIAAEDAHWDDGIFGEEYEIAPPEPDWKELTASYNRKGVTLTATMRVEGKGNLSAADADMLQDTLNKLVADPEINGIAKKLRRREN